MTNQITVTNAQMLKNHSFAAAVAAAFFGHFVIEHCSLNRHSSLVIRHS
jgi:hypothetical protein